MHFSQNYVASRVCLFIHYSNRTLVLSEQLFSNILRDMDLNLEDMTEAIRERKRSL
jgi:hypothetical protein